MDKKIKKLVHKAENLDWTYCPCNFGGEQKGYEFAKYSDYGQDFIFCIIATDKDGNYSADTMIENLYNYISNFSPTEEALKWVDADGHGANGAPYEFDDIVADMEDCKRMMWELLDAWECRV